jgi:hypothetical protein
MYMRSEGTVRSNFVERVAQALDKVVDVLMPIDTTNVDMQYLHKEERRKYDHATNDVLH